MEYDLLPGGDVYNLPPVQRSLQLAGEDLVDTLAETRNVAADFLDRDLPHPDPRAAARRLDQCRGRVEELLASEAMASLPRAGSAIAEAVYWAKQASLALGLYGGYLGKLPEPLLESLPPAARGEFEEPRLALSPLSAAAVHELKLRLSDEIRMAASAYSTDADDGHPICDHSTDYASVIWYGRRFSFTPNQAACVKVLWEHWDRRTPIVGGDTILETAGVSSSRLSHVFRDHAAWKTMIQPAQKGRFQLVEPPGEAEKTMAPTKLHT